MQRRSLWLTLFASCAMALFAFQGCSASSRSKFGGSGSTATTSSDGAGGDCLLCGTGGGTGGDQAGVILVTPAVSSLAVTGGVIPTQQFTAKLNGADVSNNVTWVVEKPDVATITATGLLAPTGKVGGETKILALYGTSKGEAVVTITVDVLVNTANVSASDQQLLDNAVKSDPNFVFTYPLADTIVPLRVLSPEFMWQNSKSVQAYRLRLSSKNITYTEYFTAANPGLKALPQELWENIQFSGMGPVSDPLKVELSRLSNGQADASAPLSFGIAQGFVFGSVYYWQLPSGQGGGSSNGKVLAGICGMNDGGGWTFDSNNGDLTVAELNATQDQVVSSKGIVPKGNLQGRPAYPTFTPDSKYLAYGRPTSGSRSSGNGTLWLTDVAGMSPIELKKASGDGRSFNPVFAPKSAGGYTWIVFISKRDYGHKLVNSGIQQLWMVAIDDPPQPGVDPSHPPFYLRGQIPNQFSENAYYALDPCKKDGESCEHGIECCNKSCIYDDGQKKHICKPPEGGNCIPTGSGPCKTDVDCCDFKDDVVCLNGFCELKPPI